MIPPHRKTPDYPRSNLGAYVAQVMQLFNPACEGSEVSKVERKCAELWDKLAPDEQTVALARVHILYTLFGQHTHTPLLAGKDLAFEDWYLRMADLRVEPKELARDAWRCGKKFQDERNLHLAEKARLDYMRLEDTVEDACRVLHQADDITTAGVSLLPGVYSRHIKKALKILGAEEEEED